MIDMLSNIPFRNKLTIVSFLDGNPPYTIARDNQYGTEEPRPDRNGISGSDHDQPNRVVASADHRSLDDQPTQGLQQNQPYL
jgi:hypothetical protein